MSGKAKNLLKTFIWAIVIILILPLPVIDFLGTSFRNEITWYYLLLALPFLIYFLIGRAQKMNSGKEKLWHLLWIAPLTSLAFSLIYFTIEGTAGYQFGSLPLTLLMAGIHSLLGGLLAGMVYFKG